MAGSIRPGATATLLALAYLGFVSLGLPDAALGVAWPSLRETFALPQSGLGLILVGAGAGFLVSSTLAAPLSRSLGVGGLLAGSTALVMLALLGFALAPSWPVLVLLCAPLLGLGSGAIDAGLNAYAASRFSARHMNWLHAAYGFGTAVGPLVMTAMLLVGGSWRWGYGAIAAFMLLLAALFTATRASWDGGAAPAPATEGARGGRLLGRPLVWLQILIFFVYTGIEVTAGQWAFALLSEARGLGTSAAGFWTAMFWAGLFAGRVVLGALADRIGPDRLVGWGTLGAALAAGLLAFAPTVLGLGALALLGLSLAPIYPMLMLRTPGRLGQAHGAQAIGFQVSAAMLGAMTWPTIAGALSDLFGLETIPVLVVAMSALLCALMAVLFRAKSTRSPQTAAP